MDTQQRRAKIIEVLCQRRHDTMQHLAAEFHVTSRTIQNDVVYLSQFYPLWTVCGRYGGGVHVMEEFHLNSIWLTPRQWEVLQQLAARLTGEEQEAVLSVLHTAVAL